MPSATRLYALILLLLGLSLGSAAQAVSLFGDSKTRGFLPVDEAFVFSEGVEPGQLVLSWEITPGHYLYDKSLSLQWLSPGHGDLPVQFTLLQPGDWHDDANFGRVKIHRDELTLVLPAPARAREGTATLEVTYQGCADAGLCYPPERRQVSVALADWTALTDAGPKAEALPPDMASADQETATAASALPASTRSDALSQWLADASLPLVMLTFLVLGIGLAFTPCVLPMLPILSAIISGAQRADKPLGSGRGLALALSYVLGMCLVYTALGLLIAGLGAAANVSVWLQHPAVLIPFAVMFLSLAVMLWRGSALALPDWLTERLTRWQGNQAGGSLPSVFAMGAISSLIVSPCVSAPLAGIMLYLSTTQDLWLGGAALFSLSLGMGLPLLLIGAGGGRWLPRSGPWLTVTKQVFALLLVAVAISLINRLLPIASQLLLWAGFSAMIALLLAQRPGRWQLRHVLTWLLVIALLAWSGLLVWGASRGGSDLLRPWQADMPATGTGTESAQFRRITDPAVLDMAVAEARAAGRPVLIDVYADWCVSCVEMERTVFPRAEVKALLAGGVLLKFDITDTSAAQLDWLQRENLFGPPAFVAWNGQGRKAPPLVGESTRETFMEFVEKSWN